MRISVKLNEEWFVVPCEDGKLKVQWLIQETCRRFKEAHESVVSLPHTEFEARLAQGGALLSKEDRINEVLNNNEFVILWNKSASKVQASSSLNGNTNYSHKFINNTNKEFITLDGYSLKPEDLVRLGKGELLIKLSPDAVKRVNDARKFIDDIVREKRPVYGINTGFGRFANVAVEPDKLKILQENLVTSHSAGVGDPLPPEKTRMLMALRINILSKGFSGISLKTLNQYVDAFNVSCLPLVPEQGTVGASGDLAPLSHLATGLMGIGKMWSPETGFADAKMVLETHGLEPISLQPKEGLALINGTQLITSLGAEALVRAKNVAKHADVIAAMTLEVLKGTTRAFDKDVHAIRPHKGQNMVAERLRALLNTENQPSKISESHRFCERIQDAYTLRCSPQVHGIANDTIAFVEGIIETEMNSATDNPLVFAERKETISGGNFHGEYPAKALDYLAIGVHELASISERRLERLVHPGYSDLPAFLVKEGGLNSGFMIAHCTAAALVSENKVLCHPSSVDSITTSAGTEDHVSMGGFAARKALKVVENVEKVLAIELLGACQGIDLLRPLTTTKPLENVYALVRSVAKQWDKDRFMAPDIDATVELLRNGKIWETVEPYITKYIKGGDESAGIVSHGSPTSRTTQYEEAPRKNLKT